MIGESGTGRHGTLYHYYKCAKAKRGKTCKKKTVKKDAIEKFVAVCVQSFFLHDDVIDKLTDDLIEFHKRESAVLPLLKKQFANTEKAINNILNAIQQGIFTSSTKGRLEALEAEKEDLEIRIVQEQMVRPLMTKEFTTFWIRQFIDGDVNDPAYQQRMFDAFLNAVYLHDNKILIVCNCKDGTETITFDEIQCSDLFGDAPPRRIRIDITFMRILFLLLFY